MTEVKKIKMQVEANHVVTCHSECLKYMQDVRITKGSPAVLVFFASQKCWFIAIIVKERRVKLRKKGLYSADTVKV